MSPALHIDIVMDVVVNKPSAAMRWAFCLMLSKVSESQLDDVWNLLRRNRLLYLHPYKDCVKP